MTIFTKTVLFTDADGRAKFREDTLALSEDGSSRVFGPGDHFYSADTLPAGATFDPTVHGHWSRQVGPEPLVTLFVRG